MGPPIVGCQFVNSHGIGKQQKAFRLTSIGRTATSYAVVVMVAFGEEL